MNLRLFSSVGFLLVASSLNTARAQTLPQPTELIQTANAMSDLSGVGPFRLDATIVVDRGTSGEKKGQLAIFQDHERSRSELKWGDFRELDVVLESKLYIVRNAPGRLRELGDLPNVRKIWRVRLSPRDKLGQTFSMEQQGIRANCFAAEVDRETHRYCFDPATRLLIENAWTKHNKPKGEPILETRYLDYQEIEGRYYPGAIRRFAQAKVDDETDNLKLAMLRGGPEIENIQVTRAQIDPLLFLVPENAREFETCDDLQPARLKSSGGSVYPPSAMSAHLEGDIRVAAVVSENGTLEDMKPLSGPPVLIEAALDAIKKWRFSPAMCGTKPVAVETLIQVGFHK